MTCNVTISLKFKDRIQGNNESWKVSLLIGS